MSTAATEWEGSELVLVLGDFHIPHRSEDIPDVFKDLLKRKVNHVLCTGNLCMKSTEEYVRSLGYNAHFVKGDLDAGLDFPDSKVVKIGEVTVGLLHGHQVVPWGDPAMLANQARSMAVDILVSGHTHAAEVLCAEGSTSAPAAKSSGATGSTLFLNPGSITGAYSPFTTNVMPSFLLLAIQGGNVTVYQYEIGAEQQVVVTKIEWKKQ